MHVTKHDDHSPLNFFKRTISAQIHLIGLLVAMAGWATLCYLTYQNPDPKHFQACFAFGFTSLLVFGASTVYHFLSDGYKLSESLERWLETLDHFAIYLFIAGSYTPVLINTLSNPWANILLFGIWIIAIVGILYTYYKPRLPNWAKHRFIYTGIFLAMGWLVVIRAHELFANLSEVGILFLVLGGLSYTVGAVVYATKRPVLFAGVFGFHELWHTFVLIGYVCHYVMILNFYWK